jgi:hypothetical protein
MIITDLITAFHIWVDIYGALFAFLIATIPIAAWIIVDSVDRIAQED